MSPTVYDLVVLGGGPAGYVAAIRGAQLGLKKIAVLEKDRPGGVCLNWGCIPSKALIHYAEVFRTIPEMERMGLKVDRKGFDYAKVFEKSRKAADSLSAGVQFLLKKNQIELIKGEFTFSDKITLTSTDGVKVTGKAIIIATGSRPREIPGFAIDEKRVLSSTGALNLKALPKKALILGSGAIGIEFAHVWNAFGVEVHVVEMLDRILPLEDEEAVQVVKKSMEKRGIRFSTGARATGVQWEGDVGTVELQQKDGSTGKETTDVLLLAVGRAPNTEGLGLEKLGIILEKGFVKVSDYYQTAVSHIYAIGDVVASPLLAHVGSKEGELAVEHIAGHPSEKTIDPHLIPACTYCEPQVASFGLTEWKAKEEKRAYQKAVFPYRGAGKSVCIEKTEGLVKILFDPKTHEILGAHIVGAEATELIHELLLAKKAELLPEDLATMIHAHPTLSEAVMEAARGVEGWTVHA